MYPGAKPRKFVLENGVEAWTTGASKYVQEAVSNSEAYLHENFGVGSLQISLLIHLFRSIIH